MARAIRWTVLNDDRRENLVGRTIRPSEELLRVGNLEGAWQVELKVLEYAQKFCFSLRSAFKDLTFCNG